MKKIKNEIVRRGLAFAIAFTMAATAVPFAGDTAYGATATTGVKTVESKLSEDAADYICGVYGETTAALNLRVGPGTGYESVHVTQKGDKLTLKGYEYVSGIKWYKTEYSGKTVYCSGEYVELVTTDFAENRVGKVISGTYLKKNLCEEEGNVTYLQEGVFFDLITRYETENGYWYEISVDGMTGFVKGEDVNTNPLIEAVTFDFIIYAKSEDGMELREGSSTSYDIVYTLEEGVSLELTGYRDTGKGLWYRCEYNGQTLYASADEIDITDYQYEDRLGKALENMNVYYRPTSQSDVVATVPKGEYFDLYIRINTSAGYMYMLEYNGITGYAYGDQISSNPVMDTIEFTSPVYAKTTDDLNMREGASTQYEIVAVAPKGSEITLLYQIEKGSGNWYKCIYAGKTVYCNAEYVEFITTVYADYRLGMIKNDTYLKENVGNDFDNVKLVEKDTVVKLINRYETTDGYWHEVSVDGVTGCVPAEVINTNPRIETVNFTNKIYGKTIKEANLMAGPNTTYDVVFTVKKGTALTVTGYILTGKGMYYTCKYSGKTVYVHENYATWDYTTYNEGRFGKAASKITFYKGVGTATEKYGTIASGEIFDLYSKIKSDEGYFYKIKYDGNIGYVVADDSVNENPLIDSYSLSSGTYCKTTAKVVIRSKSSSKGSAVATVSKGTSLIAVARIEKSAGDWYKVKYGSKIGYLQEEYLNLVEKTYSPENLASSQKAISVREGVGTNYEQYSARALQAARACQAAVVAAFCQKRKESMDVA